MVANNTDKKKYRNNFLSNVICRMDFRPIPEIDKDFFESFRAAVKGEFPVIEEQKLMGISTKIKKGKGLEQTEIPEKSIFHYKDASEKNVIVLSGEHLAIESHDYVNYREFKKIIELALDTLTSLFKNPDFTRLALRYINQIVLSRGNPFVWTNYIYSSFVAVIDRFFDKSPNIARMMSQVILNFDDYKVNFNYGMHNSEFPAKISRKEFILDFDFYTEYVEQDQIMPMLKKFNKESAKMFERCIKDGLRNHMEVIDE
jgi:uncharacterized protein (TIGR04255 family)